jgi:hypothetical protein
MNQKYASSWAALQNDFGPAFFAYLLEKSVINMT